jgi:hypothetical protein
MLMCYGHRYLNSEVIWWGCEIIQKFHKIGQITRKIYEIYKIYKIYEMEKWYF